MIWLLKDLRTKEELNNIYKNIKITNKYKYDKYNMVQFEYKGFEGEVQDFKEVDIKDHILDYLLDNEYMNYEGELINGGLNNG